MTARTPVDAILEATARDGGGTFAPDGEPFRDIRPRQHGVPRGHAYAVAVAPVYVGPVAGLYDAIETAVRVTAARGAMAHYVGTWRDDATWYVDLVRVIYGRSHAVRLGRRYAQLAIYDLTAGETVRL